MLAGRKYLRKAEAQALAWQTDKEVGARSPTPLIGCGSLSDITVGHIVLRTWLLCKLLLMIDTRGLFLN